MFKPGHATDISQQHADALEEENDPMVSAIMRDMRRILPYHPMWGDPVKVKLFRDSMKDAFTYRPGEAKSATEAELARVRGAEIGEGESDDQHEYLDGPEGAAKWNRMRKKL